MLEKRKYPRYRILPSLALEIRIVREIPLADFEPDVLALAGCGFYARMPEPGLDLGDSLQIEIGWPSKNLKFVSISGTIRCVSQDEKTSRFYFGIEFSEEFFAKLDPFIGYLETLVSSQAIPRTSFIKTKSS